MAKKEDLRVRKTKANLYKGLLQLMEEKSFEDIKVIDICNISLINRSTFYDHFNDKFELLTSLMNDTKEELMEQLNQNKDIKINNNSIAHDMMLDAANTAVTEEIKERCINHSNIPIETISLFYVSGAIATLSESIQDPDKYNEEKLLYELDKLVPELDYLELKK